MKKLLVLISSVSAVVLVIVTQLHAENLKDLTSWDLGEEQPPSYAEAYMSIENPCYSWVEVAYLAWFNKHGDEMGGFANREGQYAGPSRVVDMDPDSTAYRLHKLSIDKVWDGASLRETEKAVLEECKSTPPNEMELP